MSSTLHTFAVLAYKESPFLRECLASLLTQSVRSSIIIVTSTPSDFLKNLAGEFAVELLINSSSTGIASDWSFGLQSATTPLVTLAHQDDIYLPDFCSATLMAFGRHPDSLIAFTDYSEIVGNSVQHTNSLLRIKRLMRFPFFLLGHSINSRWAKRAFLALGSAIPCPSVTYNLSAIGEFKFSSELSINMDWDAWLRLADLPGAFSYVRGNLMQHRIHSESATTAGLRSQQRAQEDREIFARMWPAPLVGPIARLYAISYRSNSKGR